MLKFVFIGEDKNNRLFIKNVNLDILLVGILFFKYQIFDKLTKGLNNYSTLEKSIISLIAIVFIVYIRVFCYVVESFIFLLLLWLFCESYILYQQRNNILYNIVFTIIGCSIIN